MELNFNIDNVRYAFGKLDRVHINGMACKVIYHSEEGYVFGADDSEALAHSYSHEQLSRLGAQGRIRVELGYYDPASARKRLVQSASFIDDLPFKTRVRLSKKDAYCEAILELRRDGLIKMTDEGLDANMALIKGKALAYAGKHTRVGDRKLDISGNFDEAPSPRTLRRWLEAKEELGLVGLADAMHRRGNRTRVMGPEEIGLLMTEVRKYLSPEKPTIKMIHEGVQIAFDKRNAERVKVGLGVLTTPSRETVRRAVRELDPFQVTLAREGEAAARKKYRPVFEGLYLARPLQRVEIDEWQIDLITLMKSSGMYDLLTDEERAALGLDKKKARWWITAAICCTTRCILSMVLSREPGGEAATQAVQMIMTNKGKWADAVGALTAWDMHGRPELIVTDGGAAFKSERFRFACADLAIATEIAINGVPEVRGTIERVFKTFVLDLMPRLSGRTFSNILEKGDSDPTKRAALTVDDLTFALVRWVVDIYHNTPHRGLDGETPIACWRRLSTQWGVMPPPDMHTARTVFGQHKTATLDKTGITILKVRYHSEKLAAWLRREGSCTVNVRWHPKDIGAVSVQLGDRWHEVPSVDASLEGVSAQTWLTATRTVRAGNPKSNRLDLPAVRQGIKAIEERNEAAMASASLNLEDWSAEAFDRAEKNVLAGVEFHERASGPQNDSELGRAIRHHVEPSDAAPPAQRTEAERAGSAPKTQTTLNIEED
ncbi:Mu transposase C-terminal domain-containing protein [Rhodovulum sulfidophilum]|uniref:DDE-type integrase/transposase/recombinase n=1 Tax=Rhodovulum sulfidophilum TaxID=35806 RepID=A0ABS1RUT7_RHOSU|nr:Mu transposase C-terminal domain-containing protein [Rhodovulum sulfidophilum]MBL3609835.1 DDE-type integrase/transposase/recombinase [Rhodovulum sulfidophilum]MCE8458101.1 Mu transposase C-terminal domain-containing protein [Rhodovulum sulfidophilum]